MEGGDSVSGAYAKVSERRRFSLLCIDGPPHISPSIQPFCPRHFLMALVTNFCLLSSATFFPIMNLQFPKHHDVGPCDHH